MVVRVWVTGALHVIFKQFGATLHIKTTSGLHFCYYYSLQFIGLQTFIGILLFKYYLGFRIYNCCLGCTSTRLMLCSKSRCNMFGVSEAVAAKQLHLEKASLIVGCMGMAVYLFSFIYSCRIFWGLVISAISAVTCAC